MNTFALCAAVQPVSPTLHQDVGPPNIDDVPLIALPFDPADESMVSKGDLAIVGKDVGVPQPPPPHAEPRPLPSPKEPTKAERERERNIL